MPETICGWALIKKGRESVEQAPCQDGFAVCSESVCADKIILNAEKYVLLQKNTAECWDSGCVVC